ncbi:MAG: hypothetical protein Ct9H300mP4_01850 [Gammaproteobacteria bacterium]|nr:MAG: hypothetical protein Ct9H300mP4_01850 [Gammaproteobacteria bacterium]
MRDPADKNRKIFDVIVLLPNNLISILSYEKSDLFSI